MNPSEKLHENRPGSFRMPIIPGISVKRRGVVTVNEELISNFVDDYRSHTGDSASDVEFFLGYLPLHSTDGLCGDNAEAETVGSLLGNFVLSGFFGGVWLRDVLELSASAESPAKRRTEFISNLLFKIFTIPARAGVKTSLEGKNSTVFIFNFLSVVPFMIFYGYNWGYFNYILNNPPIGASSQKKYKAVCRRFLDCFMPYETPDVLERYEPVLEKLYMTDTNSRQNKRWRQMNLMMKLLGGFSTRTGAFVWNKVMKDTMPVALYDLLLELSGRYMLVAELCLLPAMKGYADSDGKAGRCAILQQVAMFLWTGCYALGLTSDTPAEMFPSCEAK